MTMSPQRCIRRVLLVCLCFVWVQSRTHKNSSNVRFHSLNLLEELFSNSTLERSNRCLQSLLKSQAHSSNSTTTFVEQLYQSSASTAEIFLSRPNGQTTYFSAFDQCQQIPIRQNLESQFCFLTLRLRHEYIFRDDAHFPLPVVSGQVPFAFGVCVPTFCSREDLLELVKHQQQNSISTDQNADPLWKMFTLDIEHCQSRTPEEKSHPLVSDVNLDYFYKVWPLCLIFAILGIALSVGTAVDWLRLSVFRRSPLSVVLCFSLLRNVKQLFSFVRRENKSGSTNKQAATESTPTKTYHNVESINNNRLEFDSDTGTHRAVPLDFLDGIRVFAILWVVIAHCSSYTQVPGLMNISPFANFPEDLLKQSQDSWLVSAYLKSTYFPVSIFFMISGIVTIYNLRKSTTKCDGGLHFVRHILARLFRVLPSLLMLMLGTYFLKYLGTGPLFTETAVGPFTEPCRSGWLSHLTLTHNWLPIARRCGSHTWFVAADFQLQIIAFSIIHLIRCRRQWFWGLALLFGLMAVSGLIPLGLTFFEFGKMPNFNVFIDSQTDTSSSLHDLQLFYYATYMHAPAFLTGILLGYILSSNWNFDLIQKNKTLRAVTLLVSVSSLLLSPLVMQFLVFDSNFSPCWTTILFQIVAHSFNISLFMFILVLALNRRLLVTRTFSAAAFRPMSRCVFAMYLIHQPLIWFTVYQTRTPISINVFSLASFTCAIISLSIPICILFYLCVEAPFVGVGKHFFSSSSFFTSPRTRHVKPGGQLTDAAENGNSNIPLRTLK